jgi:hypothetical protein
VFRPSGIIQFCSVSNVMVLQLVCVYKYIFRFNKLQISIQCSGSELNSV